MSVSAPLLTVVRNRILENVRELEKYGVEAFQMEKEPLEGKRSTERILCLASYICKKCESLRNQGDTMTFQVR